jgi:hypothetical protein
MAGSCAARAREPRQVRKEAALSGPPGAGRPISAPAVAMPQHNGSWRTPTRRVRVPKAIPSTYDVEVPDVDDDDIDEMWKNLPELDNLFHIISSHVKYKYDSFESKNMQIINLIAVYFDSVLHLLFLIL